MEKEEVMKLPWGHVEDWSALTCTFASPTTPDEFLCCKRDVDHFLTSLYEELSIELSMPYGKLKKIIRDANKGFYRTLNDVLGNINSCQSDDPNLLALQKMLLVPKPMGNPVEQCIQMFCSLEDNEKISFLVGIDLIGFKVNLNPILLRGKQQEPQVTMAYTESDSQD